MEREEVLRILLDFLSSIFIVFYIIKIIEKYNLLGEVKIAMELWLETAETGA